MPNPFAHIELTTDDLKAAQKFYGKVFAWNLKEMPGMNYTMIEVGTGTGGGMQLRPMPDAPTGWMPYVQVDDVKATVAKAVKAGAKAVLPYQEIGEMGSIGVFADPNGSVIGVWAEKAKAPVAAPKKAAAKKAAAKQAAAPAKKAAPAKAAAPAKKAAAKSKAAPTKSAAAPKKVAVPAPAKKAGKKP
ncbi:MAG TPA: VOC family protein [Polyangiaceae bacterium]|nr:VOC family protein [Polyangiaceae bacterium]